MALAIKVLEPQEESPPVASAHRGHLAPLTGLRFFAALYVVFLHFGPYPQLHLLTGPIRILQIALWDVGATGFVGVNFFFVLSGFILAYTYLDGPALRGSRRAFYAARLARIYPVYVFALVVAIGARCLKGVPLALSSLPGLFSTLTLTHSWGFVNAYPWNPPGWSLSDEAFFYLCFPFLAILVARLATRYLIVLCGILWALSMMVPLGWWAWTGVPEPVLSAHPVVRLAEFLIGVALGVMFVRKPHPSRYLAHAPAVALCLMVVVLAWLPVALYPFLETGLLDPLFAVIIFGLASGRGRVAAVLSLPLFVLLGEASYALYMLHGPIYEWMTSLLHVPVPGARYSPGFFLDYLVVAVILSVVTLRRLERPARVVIRRNLFPRGE